MTDPVVKTENQVPEQPNVTANDLQKGEMSNILAHIKKLEENNTTLKSKLDVALERNDKLSVKTREGMQSALDTLMKKWMDAVETREGKVKDDFKDGLQKLVANSAEENGVWQMMVAASSLYEKQEHNLDKLRGENQDLKLKVDGLYATPESRVDNSRKRPAEEQISRADVDTSNVGGDDMWKDFGMTIGSLY